MNKHFIPLYSLLALAITFCLLGGKVQAQSSCSNVDFETGTFNGWTGYTGTCCPINANTNGIINGQHTITSGTGVDAIIPSITEVSPYGGNFSCRLGNSGVGAQAERLVFTFAVTQANPNFTYQYAVILQDPNHTPSEQPRFQVNIRNAQGQTIPCGFYNVVAGSGVPGFQSAGSGTIIYKEWSLVAVDLTAYIGQNITVEFQTGDCDQSGHYGYAYIDASCNPLQITTNYCPGDLNATLTAPPGFQNYQWSTGQTTQSITVNSPVPGDSVTVLCTPFQGANCATTLKYKFLQYPPVNANYTVNTACGNNEVVFTDSSSIVVPGAQITGWEWIINNQSVGSQTPFTWSFPGPGNYDITLISSSNAGCPDTIQKTVTIPQGVDGNTSIPSVNVHNGYGVSCAGQSNGKAFVTATFGNPPYTYAWNTNPVSNNDTIYNLTEGTYIVTVTDANGCENIDSAVLLAPPPIVVAPVVQDVRCYGETNGSIQLNATGGVGTLNYQWSHNANLNSGNATQLAANSYNFTITDGNGCTFDSTITVAQPAAPFAYQTTKTDVNCFNACDGSIDIVGMNGNTAPYTYAWNTTPPQSTSTANNLCAGSYTCTVTDANTCSITISESITQPTQLTLSITKTDALCYGDANGTADATATGGVGNYTYLWSNGAVTTAISSLAAGNYDCTVTDGNNCTASASVTINEPTQITLTTSHQDAQCFGFNTGRVFTAVSGGTGAYGYTWSTNPVQNTATATNLVAGTYDVTVNDANNCLVTGSETLGEPTELTATISNQTDNICYGGTIGDATVTAAGGTTPYVYNWNTNPVQNSATATALSAATYNVTVTDDSLCVATATVTINQPTEITITEVVNPALCYDSAQGNITMTVTQGTPGYTYTWQPSVSNSDVATDLLAGTYNVTVTDANNCTKNRSYTISQPGQLSIAASATNALCNGSADGAVTVTTSTGGTTPYTYQLLQAGAVLANNNNGQFTGLAAGSYVAQFTDNHSCIINTPVTVSEPTQLVIQSIMADSVNCYSYSDGSVDVTAAGGTPPYTYTLGGTVNNGSGQFLNLIRGVYSVDVTDANNCQITTSAVVNEPAPIFITANPDSLVLKLGETKPIQLSTNYDPDALYSWEPWQGLDCNNCQDVNVTLYNNYRYTVTVTTHPHDLDCENKITIPVTVIPNYDVFVPNAFTPNGDGANDVFEFYGNKAAIKQVWIAVFNRIGEKVFESNEINYRWDGKFKGVPQPSGVYVYHLKLVFADNHSDNGYKGSVTLIR